MPITAFYKSKARQRKWGTWCMKCRAEIIKGEECMREQVGYNQWNCMQYNEYCMKCYKKVYAKEHKKDIKELDKEIKEKQKVLKKWNEG